MAAKASVISEKEEASLHNLSTAFFADLFIFLSENNFKDNPAVRMLLQEKLKNYLGNVGEPLNKEKLEIISSAFNKLRDESPNDPTWNVIIGAIMHEDILNIAGDKLGFLRQNHLSKSLLISQEFVLKEKGEAAVEDIKVIFETAFCDDEVREKYKKLKESNSIERALRNTFLIIFFILDEKAVIEKITALQVARKSQEADKLMLLLSPQKILLSETDNLDEYRLGVDEFRAISTDMCIAFAKVAANAVEPKLEMASGEEAKHNFKDSAPQMQIAQTGKNDSETPRSKMKGTEHEKEESLCGFLVEHFENMSTKEKIICGVALGIIAVTALTALFVFCPPAGAFAAMVGTKIAAGVGGFFSTQPIVASLSTVAAAVELGVVVGGGLLAMTAFRAKAERNCTEKFLKKNRLMINQESVFRRKRLLALAYHHLSFNLVKRFFVDTLNFH